MQQDPYRSGSKANGSDEGWSERRNGDDPFFGQGQWTQVTNRGQANGGDPRTGRPAGGSMPPAYNQPGGAPVPPADSAPSWKDVPSRGRSGGGLFRKKNASPDTARPAPGRPTQGYAPSGGPSYFGQPQGYAQAPGQPMQQGYAPAPGQPMQQGYAQAPGQPMQQGYAPLSGQPPRQAPFQPDPGQGPQPFPGQAAAPSGNTPPPAADAPEEEEEETDKAVESRTTHIRTPGPPSGPRAMPPTGIPRRDRSTPKAVYIVISIAAILAAGAAIFLMLRGTRQESANVTRSTLSTSYSGDALVVRNETVYTQEGVSRIEFGAKEGAEVQRAENVCVVYSSGFSDKELTTLANYRRKIKDYHKTLLSQTTTKDVQLDRLENNVLNLAMGIQNSIQENRGSLVNEEAQLTEAMQACQVYLRQKYPDDQKLARLYDDENTQLQRISSWTKQYAAAAGGIVSFYTDGYENALNLNNYTGYTPKEIRSMYNGSVPATSGMTKNTVAVYRLVRQGNWVVLMLCDNREWAPVEHRSYKLMIEGFESAVNATVESVSRSGGELLVRLTVAGDINIGSILYKRACRVQLGESVDSLAVPARALYTRQGRIGVVIATQSGEYWTGVEVIANDGQTAHIIPENAGVLYEGIPVLLF